MAFVLVSALVGVLVGMLSGMLGIGGGMVMVPVFRLGYGLQAIEATATSLFAIVPTSVAGLVTHVRNKTCYPKLGVAAGLGGAVTSALGVRAANASPSWLVMLAAAAVIGYSSVTMFRKARALPKPGANAAVGDGADAAQAPDAVASSPSSAGPVSAEKPAFAAKSSSAALPQSAPAQPPVPASSSSTPSPAAASPASADLAFAPRQLLLGAGIGAVAGFASGYVGVGGGFVMVPLFIGLLGTSMKKTSGTSLIAICILAVPGVLQQLVLGNVQVAVGLTMAAGAIPGAVLGANLMRRIPERELRFIFAFLLVFAAIMLLVREFGF